MSLNFRRGFFRLWIFVTFVWVTFCGWQIWDSHTQLKKAQELKTYAEKQLNDLKELEGKNSAMPFVRANLNSQLELNSAALSAQTDRFNLYVFLIWVVPLILFVFCWGIPWVLSGFQS